MREWQARLRLLKGDFLVKGSVAALFGGLGLGLFMQTGAESLDPTGLLASALISLVIFWAIGVGSALAHPWIKKLHGPRRALLLGTLFFTGGVMGWLLVFMAFQFVITGEIRLSLSRMAYPVALTGILSVVIGSVSWVFESTRERLEESVGRLKEAEFAQKELELARSIQSRLMPPEEIEGDGYRIAARNIAARYVAGDFFDVLPLEQGRLGVVVGDVSGKGVGASLVMASVKARLPLLAAGRGAAEILEELNHRLIEELARREFVAMGLGLFEPGKGTLRIANAGLPDPYLLRQGCEPEALSVPGNRLPLGLRTEIGYEELEVTLEPGDRVLMLSDGLPEAITPQGEPLGYEAFVDLLGEIPDSEPGVWLDRLLAGVAGRTTEEAGDDLTVLLLECSAT